MVQSHDGLGSTRFPIDQLSTSTPSKVHDVEKVASSHGASLPDIQPSDSDPSKLSVSRSARESSPPSQSSIPKVQLSDSPPNSQIIPPSSSSGTVLRTKGQHDNDPEKGLKTVAVEKPKFSIYQSLLKRRKAFVESPLAYNSFLVVLGIFIMLAGTFIVSAALLPKIYTCPDGATCHHNLDPKGDIIPRLQTLMQYWLQGGVFVAGLGLSNFIAYESWYVVEKPPGTTIRTLAREIRAVGGSWLDALALVLKPLKTRMRHITGPGTDSAPRTRGTRWLGILSLVQIGISFFISFVVGFSITDLQGVKNVYVPFTYRSNFAIPRQDLRFVSTGESVVLSQLNNWLLPLDGSHRPISVFDGSLVSRDNRTIFATNPQPSGHRITGNISCSRQGWNTSVMSPDDPYLADGHGALPPGAKAYNITNGIYAFVTYSYTPLSSIFVSAPELFDSVTSRQYLWASNNANIVPNATASPEGGLYYAVCNHTTRLVDLPPVVEPDAQDIHPSQPIIYTNTGPDDPFLNPCPSEDPIACLSRFIDEVVLGFWQASVVQLDMIPFSCVSDVLIGYGGLSDTPNCALDDVRWATTLGTALDALIYTAGLSENATQTQHLWAATNSINTDRWWIQITLPGVTFLLFLACMAYTFYLNRGVCPDLRELDLSEVVYRADLKRDAAEHDIELTMPASSSAG